MIIAVSIVDKHKREGERHVGTYMFEIDYTSCSHFDFMVITGSGENDAALRPYLNRLMSRAEVKAMDATLDGKAGLN